MNVSTSFRIKWFTRTLFPLFLMIVCPLSALLIWAVNVGFDGSLFSFGRFIYKSGFSHVMISIWKPVVFGSGLAWKMIIAFAILQLALMRLIPGKRIKGPITAKGNLPTYKDNGLVCFLITLCLFVVCSKIFHLFSLTIVYDNFADIIGSLNIFSLFFCLFLYIKGRFFPSSSDSGCSGNCVFDYYWGTELYPRVMGWDLKQFTNCRFGMMSWPVIILSFAAKQAEVYGLSDSMVVALIVMMTYITKFFIWESGYLRSMDIMHDRAGFMICWGCLVWVPAVYTSPILYLVNHPVHLGFTLSYFIAALGVFSVMINYFADRQRQLVRKTDGDCKVWGKKPLLIHAEYKAINGQVKKTILLASGFWGLSRHFRYLPEILGAFFWTLPALFTHALPYFYVIFLTVLLLQRSYRIEQRCKKKYASYWKEYCRIVPAHIIPTMTPLFSMFLKKKKQQSLNG